MIHSGQHRWPSAYLAACHHIYIFIICYIFLWLIKTVVVGVVGAGKSPLCLLCRVVSQIPLQRLHTNLLQTC